MFTIVNEYLSVEISGKGAELQRIFHIVNRLDYLWNGDPAFWGKKSPVLFPIVGTLKQDSYFYEGSRYHLSRHGFGRDMEFEAQPFSSTEIQFQLKSNETTLKSYPFPFVFRIGYRLHSDVLEVSYEVSNPDFKPIYFSVGGHPAFRVPLLPQTEYEDYFLEFNEEETKPRWPISPDGLITKTPEPLLRQSTMLPLTRSLFLRDAIVMKNPSSSMVSLRTDKSPRGLDLDFGEFPYLGIWAAKNADFVCIEPWEGIADSVDSDQQITGKEGIQKLEGGAVFLKTWKARFY